MLCEECGENKATVHLTKIVNNSVNEMNLCEDCAKKHKELEFDSSFSFHNFLTGLLDNVQDSQVKIDHIQGTTCDKCGMPYGKFKQTGRFGCSYCYESFKEKLAPLYKRIHGHEEHVGKVPKRAGGVIRLKKEVSVLKTQLDKAVKNEEFEKAVKLRDQIRELQQQIDNH